MSIEITPRLKHEYTIQAGERVFMLADYHSIAWYVYEETLMNLYNQLMNLEHDTTNNQIRQSKINSNKAKREKEAS